MAAAADGQRISKILGRFDKYTPKNGNNSSCVPSSWAVKTGRGSPIVAAISRVYAKWEGTHEKWTNKRCSLFPTAALVRIESDWTSTIFGLSANRFFTAGELHDTLQFTAIRCAWLSEQPKRIC